MDAQMWNLADSIRVSTVARWTSVGWLRLQTRLVLNAFRARRRARFAEPAPADGAADWLETGVLRVITRHPEGVRAFDIGNELGVDWRRVPAVAGRLVDRAIVEQVAHEYYPAKKAS